MVVVGSKERERRASRIAHTLTEARDREAYVIDSSSPWAVSSASLGSRWALTGAAPTFPLAQRTSIPLAS